jgi:branched-chain amino acid transport system ATP-binding protein
VPRGRIVPLIGAKGAGKTTLLSSICGAPRAVKGSIIFDGKDITESPTHLIARAGLAHCPEGRHVFSRMTVDENLLVGGNLLETEDYKQQRDKILELFPRLKERLGQRAGTMSGGEQQMLAIGRALMTEPKLLMLDEPSLGLSPLFVKEIFGIIRTINEKERMSVLLVEQNAVAALNVVQHAYVVDQGRIVMEGSAALLRQNPDIQEFYLGGSHAVDYHNVKHYRRRKRWLA